MQYKILTSLFLAATALAAPAPDTTASSSVTETTDSDDTFDLGDVPSSILIVLATAIPASWYNDIMDPSSRSSIASAAAAGTYPAWYNALPSSVRAWATSQVNEQLFGTTETADSTVTPTATTSSGVVETGISTTVSQTSSNAAETTSASYASVSSASVATESSSGAASESSSDSTSSSSSSASSSPSSSQSTGGAPAPTGGVAIGVAGAAGVLALALAL